MIAVRKLSAIALCKKPNQGSDFVCVPFQAAKMKRDNFLIPNVPDVPSDQQLWIGGSRFSVPTALARVEESMVSTDA